MKPTPRWFYPKVSAAAFNPPERWGHSACFFDGFLYVFGGCCGGLHFSDILTLNLETMIWTSLVTTGHKPGTRDSHTAAVVGHKMIVFGGTNGSKKVNDLHVLDMRTRQWTMPSCKGTPPSARESHTATVVGDAKLVIFGGSGEGDANYLNDIHVLDVNTMTWTSPEVKGELPAPRDSHVAVAVGNNMFIYGGDCGDRYQSEVDVVDMDTMTWSRLPTQGPSPGVRAGHAAASIGSKIYVIGGVGDKQYYSDVWVLDVSCRTWCQLDTCGPPPQGRFAHTAVVTNNNDISIYGGCGEDERPLNELLVLQLGSEHPNGRYNGAMCKVFSNHWSQEKRKFLRSDNMHRDVMTKKNEFSDRSGVMDLEARSPTIQGLDNVNAKRRRTGDTKVSEVDNEQEEHSLTISQHSSPSQSDQEPNHLHKESTSPNSSTLSGAHLFIPIKSHQEKEISNGLQGAMQKGLPFMNSECTKLCMRRQEQFLPVPVDHKPVVRPCGSHFIGAEVHGTVDGAFDSGYLMTAIVNGQIFRGVLFAPGAGVAAPRPVIHPQVLSGSSLSAHAQHRHREAAAEHARPPVHSANAGTVVPNWGHQFMRQPVHTGQLGRVKSERVNNDLKDVVLTLGGPGAGGGN